MSAGLVALFAVACGLSVANVYYAQPLLDSLALDFGLTQALVGLVVSSTQVGCAIALVLLVPLGDLLERRPLMLVQLMALAVASLGVALAQQATALLVGMLAVGMLGTAMTQGLIAYAASLAAPAQRGSVVGAAQGGVVIGLLAARVMSGSIADLAGWRAVYFTSAAMMLLLMGLLVTQLPRRGRGSSAETGPSSFPADPKLRFAWRRYFALLRSMVTLLARERVLQVRGVIGLLMFASFNIFWNALVLPLSAPPYQWSRTAIGAFGLVGVLGALGAIRAGRWADKGLGQWTTGVGLSLMLLAWWPLSSLGVLPALVIGIIALDLGGQAVHVTNQSFIFSLNPAAHSRLVGCYMLFYAVGSGLGAAASTAVFATWGWNGVCLLGASVSGLALLFWAITSRN